MVKLNLPPRLNALVASTVQFEGESTKLVDINITYLVPAVPFVLLIIKLVPEIETETKTGPAVGSVALAWLEKSLCPARFVAVRL